MNQESRIKNQGRLKAISGFTLIELIIAIALIGIMSAISIVGLNDYTRTAKLNAAANGLITTLNKAKSNSLSQMKSDPLCAGALDGYKVVITNTKTYDLYVVCGGADFPVMSTKSLPDNITFSGATSASLFFSVLTGKVVGPGTIVLSGFGKTRAVTVDLIGVISAPNTIPAVTLTPLPTAPATPTPTPTPTPTSTPTPTPTPPPAKTCTLAVSTWRSGLDAACATYCGASSPTVTCSVVDSVASQTHAKTYNYVTCTSSSSQTKSGFICVPPGTTTCTCD